MIPAAGGALEEDELPDFEESVDRALNEDERLFDSILEEGVETEGLYRQLPAAPGEKGIHFRYFLDGSFRSYFLGVISDSERETPVHFAQIGGCVLRRVDGGKVHIEELRVENVLLLGRRCVSEGLWSQLEDLSSQAGMTLIDLTEWDVMCDRLPGYDLQGRAAGKVRFAVHRLEGELIRELLPRLGEDTWLVVDGSLLFEPALGLLSESKDVKPVLGVAKCFRKDPQFSAGQGPQAERRSIYGLLADLKEGCRTAAFAARGGRLVFWYVRLRDRERLEHPFMGAVKAELVNPSGGRVSGELIDALSLYLWEERAAIPYGRSAFWHAHLYPLFLAESTVRENLLSREVVGNYFQRK